MFITGIGVATPEHCYKQSECWDALKDSPQFTTLSSRSRSILRKVLLSDNGIETRHLALDPLQVRLVLGRQIARRFQRRP